MPSNTAAVPLNVRTADGETMQRAPNVWDRLLKNSRSLTAIAILFFMLLLALAAGTLAPYDFAEQLRGREHLTPSSGHFFGTDVLGRDILSRVMYGARVSLMIGLSATVLSLVIGVTLGLCAGYFGGRIDDVIMRFTDTISAFPTLLLAVAITALYKPSPSDGADVLVLNASFWKVFIALGVVGWTSIARVVRAQVLTIKTLDYVTAARALGGDSIRIMFLHVLPNCWSPIIVLATLSIGGNILGEAGLSFLGLGIKDPFPSWGGMLSDSKSYFKDHWWLAVFPGMAIVLTVLSFNLLGDGLRDALDPKARK
ncbi:MAG: ABC transporter permease [Planctomycetota bacterium]